MSSGYTKGTPASSQIIWLEEKVKEQEQNIDTIMQINARLRDEKREANAEIKRLREKVVEIVYQIGQGDHMKAMEIAAPIAEAYIKQKVK